LPGQPGRQSDRSQQQHQQEQIAADRAKAALQRFANQHAEATASTGDIARRQAQIQEAGGADQEAHDAHQPQRRAQVILAAFFTVEAEHGNPRHRRQHQRNQVGHVAEQLPHDIGNPGPYPAADVVHGRDHRAGLRPARVRG
jgi:hypothetical protein